jgi:hypothetical protein
VSPYCRAAPTRLPAAARCGGVYPVGLICIARGTCVGSVCFLESPAFPAAVAPLLGFRLALPSFGRCGAAAPLAAVDACSARLRWVRDLLRLRVRPSGPSSRIGKAYSFAAPPAERESVRPSGLAW